MKNKLLGMLIFSLLAGTINATGVTVYVNTQPNKHVTSIELLLDKQDGTGDNEKFFIHRIIGIQEIDGKKHFVMNPSGFDECPNDPNTTTIHAHLYLRDLGFKVFGPVGATLKVYGHGGSLIEQYQITKERFQKWQLQAR